MTSNVEEAPQSEEAKANGMPPPQPIAASTQIALNIVLFAESVQVPPEYTRRQNRTHLNIVRPVEDDLRFVYGTAGFRTKDEFMSFIAYRTGVYAGYRLRKLNKSIGLMITASHNPHGDNGIKLVDPMGEMLDQTLEGELTDLINLPDEEFAQAVRRLEGEAAKMTNEMVSGCVHLGWDTRQSSVHLSLAATRGIAQAGGKYAVHSYVTTPQLHYLVRVSNDPSYGDREPIVKRFVEAVLRFRKHTPPSPQLANYKPEVFVDCANGVGAECIHEYTDPLGPLIIELGVINIDTRDHSKLNNECGADHVKLNHQLPMDFENNVEPGTRCASLDGDADRLVYFFQNAQEPHGFFLLDGDHISALFATFIRTQMKDLKMTDLKFGIIQTAYTNGGATRFFQKLKGASIVTTKTGVKHLHHAALQFDVAVYFEANGHGTVTFSRAFHDRLRELCEKQPNNAAAHRLAAFTRIVNECVGDAIADLLAVEQLLFFYDWSAEMWLEKTFTPFPTVQLKIPVENRSFYRTHDEKETELVEPPGIQACIDKIVRKYRQARAFVRPSGTENVLRVYAEAGTQADAKRLAEELKGLFSQ